MRNPPTIHLVDPVTGDLMRELIGLRALTWYNGEDESGGGDLEFSLLQHPASSDLMTIGTEIAIAVEGMWKTNSHVELIDSGRQIIHKRGKARIKKFGFMPLVNRFGETVIVPLGPRSLKRHFVGTAGFIFAMLFTEAQARGAIAELEKDWTSLLDSRNQPWDPAAILDFWMDPGSTMLDVLRYFKSQAACEWRMRAHRFRMFNYGTSGDDHLNDPLQTKIILRTGRDIQEGTRNATARGWANVAYTFGDDGRWSVGTDTDSITRNKRREKAVSASGVTDKAQINKIATLQAHAFSDPISFKTYSVPVLSGIGQAPHPYDKDSYTVGDFIGIADDISTTGPLGARVSGITLKWVLRKPIMLYLDLDLRYARRQERIDRKLEDVLSGVPGTVPSNTNRVAPAPPTFVGSMTSVLDTPPGGQTFAKVLGNIALPTLDADGQPLTDLDHVEVHWKYGTRKMWHVIQRQLFTDFDIPNLVASFGLDIVTINVEIYAVDDTNNFSLPLTGSINTAQDHGSERTWDATTGEVLLDSRNGERIAAPARFTIGNVPGSSPLDFMAPFATGPGVRFQETGFEAWATDGHESVLIDGTTGDADLDGNVTIDGALVVGAGTIVNGNFTVNSSGVAVLTVNAAGAILRGRFEGGGLIIDNDVITFEDGTTLAYDGIADVIHLSKTLWVDGNVVSITAPIGYIGKGIQVIDAYISGGLTHAGSTAGFYGHSLVGRPSTIAVALGAGAVPDAVRSIASSLDSLGLINNFLT